MNEKVSFPTGLELRFDRELAAAIPGWQREFPGMEDVPMPVVTRGEPVKRELPRHRPLVRQGPPK